MDTARRKKFKEIARALPRVPGVYFFYGVDDRLLYVGKANVLRERVRSYFADTKQHRPPKLRRLLAEIERLEYEECGCELEALLLERRLIATRRPLLNRQLKRFDVYPYLLLSDETFPRLTVTRAEPVKDNDELGTMNDELTAEERQENSSFIIHHSSLPLETAPRAGEIPGLYLGPFTTPRSAYWTMEAVRNTFPLRSCEGEIKPDENGKSCFYHEINRCCGPCVGAIGQQEYSAICADLLQLLKTGEAPQIDDLRARMEKLAQEWKFEDAAKLREQLQAVEQVVLRLRRLERIRNTNNLAIVQRAKDSETGVLRAGVFLIQGGIVRRHLCICDWETEREEVRRAIRETFSASPPTRPFTAKEELDEMMILDRWLKAHGEELCCAWLNQSDREVSHAWAGNAVRRLRAWSRRNLT